MKQGALLNKLVIFLLFLAILGYFLGAAWRGLRDPYPTVQAYSYTVEDTVEAVGYLARRERVVSGSGGIVRLLPAEGEKVAAGAAVAQLYTDQASLDRAQRAELLEAEVEQLTAAVAAAGETPQGETDTRVTNTMTALRSAVEQGDFTRLENQTTSFKSAVYQQAQRYGNAGDLSAAIASAQEEIAQLRGQNAQSAGVVTVSESGVFSGQVDGYETVLNPDIVRELTPSAIDALEGQAQSVPDTALGKLITDATWYFVCPMSEADAGRLTEEGTVTVRFSRDWSGELDMTVERIGPPENGRVAVLLSSRSFLSNVTLLRRQTVELVFSRKTGIRVPTGAVRVETAVQTDPDTGESVESAVTCVYVQVGVKAERKAVTVLGQGEDYYMVEPVLSPDAQAKEKKLALRPGDQVILASQEIWDGMILE